MPSVFDASDYKSYLRSRIAEAPRGEKSRLARAMNCHLAYLSQVLHSQAHLNLEQAEALTRHLGFTEEEIDFFLHLVHRERAGTVSLRKFYEKKSAEILKRRAVLKNRLSFKKALSISDQATYYSAWYYAAIHLLLAIPGMNSKEALANYLSLTTKQVTGVIDFLVSCGLAQNKGGRLTIGSDSIHLGSDSPLISKHHTNWRMQAIRSLEQDRQSDLHYSSVITISAEHIPKIRDALIKVIEEIRKMARSPKEERLFCYAIDLFEIGNGR